jgi:sn-glycerol 3-phosphate transport system substrate-binding protein
MMFRAVFSICAMIAMTFTPAFALTEVQWWHAMTGASNEVVETLAKEFNESQSDYKVVPVFKGTYVETLNAGIAAYRAKKAPHILQVFDVGTGTMMAAKGAIVPVPQVFSSAGLGFDKTRYLPGIVSYYSTPAGELLSFPYNSSSPILFIRKDAFRKAGLNPDAPPKTWPEVFEAAKKIKEAGWPCGLTTSWPVWIQLENFSAWNNLPFATDENGLGSLEPKLVINGALNVRHFQALADLQKAGVFSYGGRASEALGKFMNGECAMFTGSSGGLGDIVKAGFEFEAANLPYYAEAPGAPQNTVPGGASLWVLGGHSQAEYAGVARFFEFLSQTPIQVRLHQKSGYLPVTFAAYEATKGSGYYVQNPGQEIPVLQMIGKAPTANSKGVRVINLPQVRDIISEEIELMLSGKQDAKTALDRAVSRGNAAIKEAASGL